MGHTTGVQDWFTSRGLPTPPVPEPLRPALRERGRACWATREIDPYHMYMWHPQFVEDVLADRVADYVAACHWGHGANSYMINYHLVYGRLAVIMQTPWGGVYTDNAREARDLAGHWARLAAILDSPVPPGEDRLVVVYSFRGEYSCGWIPRATDGVTPGQFRRANPTDADSTFPTARRLWAGQSTVD
jgi:hypothetical protein